MFKWSLTPWWTHTERRIAVRGIGYLGRRRGAISGGLVRVGEERLPVSMDCYLLDVASVLIGHVDDSAV
jgi:hypothetical protein